MGKTYGFVVTNGEGFIGYDSASGGYPYMARGIYGAHIFDSIEKAEDAIENDRTYIGAKSVWIAEIVVRATQRNG